MALTDKLTAIANAIRVEIGGTEPLTLEQMAVEIARIQTGGGEDLFQYATNASYLFNNAKFPNGYELLLNIPNFKESLDRVLRYATGVRKVTLKGNVNNVAASFQYAFQGNANTSIEIIDAIQWGEGGLKPSYANSCFSSTKLHTILGEIDMSACVNTNNMFADAYALLEVRFKENTIGSIYSENAKVISFINSPVLSDASIQSIIDGLADLTGATAQTLTLHATVGGKLTEAQKATVTAKNWTLVY
jgi:hypothetical protein